MKNKSLNVVFSSIDEYNDQINDKVTINKSTDTILIGLNSKLDSLGVVNLLVIIEQNIEDEFDVNITIADEKAISQKNSPFRTIGTLADYIDKLLSDNQISK